MKVKGKGKRESDLMMSLDGYYLEVAVQKTVDTLYVIEDKRSRRLHDRGTGAALVGTFDDKGEDLSVLSFLHFLMGSPLSTASR